MPYNITLTNGALFATIPDGTLNNASSMTLIGQNYVGGYGEFQNDNFMRLLESGANNIAPTAPLVGQLWYNTATKVLEVYNGSGFKPLGGANASASPPGNNTVGDLWYNTAGDQLYAWTGTSWLLIGPVGGSGTGAATATITDTNTTPHEVIEFITSGNIVSIVSQDATFTPANAIAGFANISPGINLSSIVNGQTPLFTGMATDSQKLGGVYANSYVSAVSNSSTTGSFRILNNAGLGVGVNSEFTATVSNTSVSLKNTANNGDFDIAINKNGAETVVLHVDGATGNLVIASNLQVTGTTVTVNQEIINTSEVIAGNVTAGNVISNAGMYTRSITSTTSIIGNVANITTMIGTSANITTVTATTATANTFNGNLSATTANAVRFNTASWTIQEFAGKLYFQTAGDNVASLDSDGNFITSGDITAFGNP